MRTQNKSTVEGIRILLTGGGVKGYSHAGFLEALLHLGIKIGMVTGVSIGSVIATLYTNGKSPKEIEEILLEEINVLGGSKLSKGIALRDILLGGIDLKSLFTELVKKYNLKPQPNLTIVAFNIMSGQPKYFVGTDYDDDLATALAASCSVPGVMRPVWLGENDLFNVAKILWQSWRGKTDKGLLIDGGAFRNHTGFMGDETAIVSKLGYASKKHPEKLAGFDRFAHFVERVGSPFLRWYFKDPSQHIIVKTGKEDVASLTFGISRRQCKQMVNYAYRVTMQEVGKAIDDGRIPQSAIQHEQHA